LVSRSSLTRAICIELFRCPAIKETILEEVRNLSSEFLPKRGESYSVRIKRVKGSSSHLDIPEMERVIGSFFFHQTDNLIQENQAQHLLQHNLDRFECFYLYRKVIDLAAWDCILIHSVKHNLMLL